MVGGFMVGPPTATSPPMMVLYGSASFVHRLKCQVSLPEHRPAQVQTVDGWSGDVLKVARVEAVAVMMHDASLATIVVPLGGVRRFEDFLPRFLAQVTSLFKSVGGSINSANQSVLVLRRTNRRLIGSMNNVKQLIGFTIADQRQAGESVDWMEAQTFVNRTPFSVIGFASPLEALRSFRSGEKSPPCL